ncbi:MAG TPA: PLP-dependent aminotransferase family protein [Vicinamibacterales bacterium]|nr:PLP-dependent aminotransferase family protein [Vicinamibacterales bacterium]
MQTLWSERFAQRTQGMRRSEVRELLKLTEQPGIISFGGGLPAPEVFPIKEFERACATVLKEAGARALQYSTTEGYRPLREMIARHTCRYGVAVTADNIMITSGSQQALDLIGKVLINPGDHILVERPTYLAAIQAWTTYQAQYIPVPIDDDGMLPDALEAALRGGPKFIYALPNFQNPTGVTLSLERRRTLVRLADHYGVPIIEDDPYGQLRYEGEHVASIVSVDSEYRSGDGKPYSGNVMYMSTFSKTLAPGLRLGWLTGPTDVIERLVQAKQGADLHTATFNQMVAYEVARGGFLDEHVKTIRRVYRARRDAMLAAMAEFFPAGVTWTKPQGGLFLWVRFPEFLDAADILRESVNEGVAFLVGSAFFPDRSNANTARFNFSNADPVAIRDGIRRIGLVLARMLKPAGV